MKRCSRCGAEVLETSTVCPKCFQKLEAVNIRAANTFNKKSKLIAAFLAFCFGGIGLHKFYLGKPKEAVFYILFCWTFIPAFIGGVECVIYLFMTTEEFDKKYNSQ